MELDRAGHRGEERVVPTLAHTCPGVDVGTALAHDDRARRDLLSGEALDPEALGLGVASVAGGPAALLVRHDRSRVAGHPSPALPKAGSGRPGPLVRRLS